MQLARLAAAYLAVDRIVLTDRFADFVREFTIRAASAKFSLNQMDQLFRKYDEPRAITFERGAREVVAGIERLLYVNFYQLNRLVRAMRYRRGKLGAKLAKQLVQQWLNRMNVGEEMLGAEPLGDLIKHFIPTDDSSDFLRKESDDGEILKGSFQQFLRDASCF